MYGERFSTLVNYDWYHPRYAHRYELNEVEQWFERNQLRLVEETSTDVQHYLKGQKEAPEADHGLA